MFAVLLNKLYRSLRLICLKLFVLLQENEVIFSHSTPCTHVITELHFTEACIAESSSFDSKNLVVAILTNSF